MHRSRSSEAREGRRGISDTGPIAKIRAPPSHLTAAVAHRRSEDQVCWLQDHHSRRCDGHHGNRATFQRTSCTGVCESSRNWNARYEDLLRRLSIIRSADPTELQLGEAARHLALDSAYALVIRLVARGCWYRPAIRCAQLRSGQHRTASLHAMERALRETLARGHHLSRGRRTLCVHERPFAITAPRSLERQLAMAESNGRYSRADNSSQRVLRACNDAMKLTTGAPLSAWAPAVADRRAVNALRLQKQLARQR